MKSSRESDPLLAKYMSDHSAGFIQRLFNLLKCFEAAQDVFDDAYIEIRRGRRRVSDVRSADAMIHAILRRRAIDRRDADNRRRRREQTGTDLPDTTADSSEDDISEMAARRMIRCLDGMSPVHQTALLRSVFGEWPAVEVGRSLGLTVDAVYQIRSKAKQSLCVGGDI